MRLNNNAARKVIDQWLGKTGRTPISWDIPYEQYANEVRKIAEPGIDHPPFSGRAQAVAYIRDLAKSKS